MIHYLILWISCLLIGLFIGFAMSVITRTRRRRWVDSLVGVAGAFIGGFFYNLVKTVGITDFNPWSLPAAAFASLMFLSVFRWVNRREQPFGITKEDFDEDKIVVVRDLPAEEGLRDELSADAAPPPEFTDEEVETKIRVGHEYVPALVPILFIVFLPILDMLMLYLRFPDISQQTAPFGTVETHTGEAGQLKYLVYAPSNSAESMPLLLMLHGCTQDPYILEAASGMKNLADANSFILVYPQQNFMSSPHRCWNWYNRANQMRDTGEAALLAGIVNDVKAAYNVDTNRVYLAGISSGGAMTSILASCYPDMFAAGAVHSGMAYEASTNFIEALLAPITGSATPPPQAGQDAYACSGQQNQTIPMIVLQGREDDVVHHENGLDTIEQFAQMNDLADDGSDNDSVNAEFTSGEPQEVEGGYSYTIANFEFNGELLLQYYSIEGLNHMWSGGTGIFPLSDPKAPNASQIFWDFLSAHSLQQ